MPLEPGQMLSHYRVVEKIGEGGMGEVYRATDSKLRRDVAIKILPEGFAEDPDRLARFEREAHVLASLNHPNIAAIYGLEESDGVRCLVLELIEGKGLDDIIAAGPMATEKALTLALQIAEALEAAHEKGIIHRDLKPANVKVTPDGTVKVLDFGLAKAFGDDSGQGSTDASLSPTLTAAATQAGIILGTAAYMSPEQAAGQAADRRSDVWSFGVVLLEMLTGNRLFTGETVSHILASVLKEEPDWDRVPQDLPPRLLELLKTCLRKKPRERLQAIGDARILLEEYGADPKSFVAVAPLGLTVAAAEAPWRRRLPWVAAGLLATALAATLWILWPRPAPPRAATRLSIPTPDGAFLFRGYGSSVVFSPDGSRIVYVTNNPDDGRTMTLRSLDQRTGIELGDDEGPYHPFFSPDGQWVGFVNRRELKKVPVRGGSSIKLCDVALSRGASWGPDGNIIFAPDPRSGLFRVSAAGGKPEPLTELDEARNEESHRWPQVLPGGKAVLFTSSTTDDDSYDSARLELLILDSGDRKVLYEGASYGRYLGTGHITYINRGTLFAFPFDLATGEVTGSSAPIVEGVSSESSRGGAHYSVSEDGSLVYATGGAAATGTTLVWVDRQGAFTPLWDNAQDYTNPELSPDGTRLAIDIESEGNLDIWVYDLERDVPTRLTFGEGDDWGPVWSPDGEWIYFASEENGIEHIQRTPADGSGGSERVLESKSDSVPTSVSPDGTRLLYREQVAGIPDLWILPLDGGEPEPFLVSAAVNYGARFSPDGRWILYGTNESGRFEVYVRPAAGGRGRWQISTGGAYPRWSRDGRRIYYRGLGDGELLAVEVQAEGDAFQAGRPESLFQGPFLISADGDIRFDVDGDEQRFVMLHERETLEERHEHLHVVLDWFDELESTFADVGGGVR